MSNPIRRAQSDSSGSDQNSGSDTEVSDAPPDGHSSGSEAEGDENVALASYYDQLDRVDDKEVTLTLHKRTIKLFFEKILGKGELDRDGRELLQDKYYILRPIQEVGCSRPPFHQATFGQVPGLQWAVRYAGHSAREAEGLVQGTAFHL